MIVILYQIFVVWLAFKNASWSNPEEKHKIKHWLNGLCHLTAAGVVYVVFHDPFDSLSLLLITRVVFDTAMNVFRHKGVGYVSPAPASIIDKIEKEIVFWIAGKVHKKRTIIPEEDIERVAIGFRIFILGLAITFLFL